jgi:hypothetical protein
VINGGGTDCPGDTRKAQFWAELVPMLTGATAANPTEDLTIMDPDTRKYLDARFDGVLRELEARSNNEISSLGDVIGQLKRAIATGDANASNNVVAFLTAVVGQSKDEIIASAKGMQAAAAGLKP